MCRSAAAVLLGWILLFMTPAVDASELTRQTKSRDDIANRLNREQVLRPSVPSVKSASSVATAEPVGILFLRGDGGDPQEVRGDAEDNLILIVQRNGEGRAYRNGRQVDIDPLVKESASQIAVTQFGAPTGTPIPQSELSASAQAALTGFAGNGVKPRVIFAHIASREDTARVSDQRAAKILAMEATSRGAHRADMIELVRTAMRMFDLKSDACDKSLDPRCNRPGVREAFAQIKQEEAIQRASASRQN